MWFDKLTNGRGKKLEEFLISKQLFVINEKSEMKTFQSSRGSSNIDLTISNNILLKEVQEWKISEEETCSDHRMIQFCIRQQNALQTRNNFQGIKYITRGGNLNKFEALLSHKIAKRMCESSWEKDTKDLDQYISSRIADTDDMEDIVNKFSEALKEACNKSFKIGREFMKTRKHKTVPWWTEDLTIARKRVNAFRKKYQRTKNNGNLRDQRQTEYQAEKAQYQAKIKKAKLHSWKQYCNKTSPTNPWNIVYKSAAGKLNNSQIISTLQKTNGLNTENLRETLQCTLEQLIPKDEVTEETDHHKKIRTFTEEPMETEDNMEFTTEEIRQAIKSIDHKKAPGEDGITSKIIMWTFERFPQIMISLYNGCLSKGCFPKRWKRARIIPLIKPGKENSNDASKYRPISLLNVGGKMLEKLLINSIMHYLYSNNLLNPNQYGFSPQKSTTDAAMAVKDFIDEALTKGQIVALVSLDVKGAFDAAWWSRILKALKDFHCPRNLYNLTKNYFSGRSAYISTNSMRIDTTVNKGCPQGSCCGPGYWNIQYNSLLNLNFAKWTRAIAFADDLLLAVKATTVAEVENFTNMEMIKITKWSKENKLHFNDQKSKLY